MKPQKSSTETQSSPDPSEALEPLSPKIIDILITNQSEFKKFLRKRIFEASTVDDIFQSSIMQAFEKQATLKQQESMVPWFYQILRNSLIDHYRSRAKESKNKDEFQKEISDLEKENTSWKDELKTEVCHCMSRLLSTLKPNYAELLKRIDLEEQAPEVLAGELGITLNNLTVRLHRARQALKISLERSCGSCARHGCLNCTCE